MAELTPQFSSNRMVREYVERLYLPASRLYHSRIADGVSKAALFSRWRGSLEKHWGELNLGQFSVRKENGEYTFMVQLHLGKVHPDYVRVELYAEPSNSQGAEVHAMERREALTDTVQGYLYVVRLPAHRPASDYTPRVVPFFDGAVLPLEAPYIRWFERTT